MSALRLSAPQPLSVQHTLADFESGEPSLDDWLKRRAARNQANGSSRISRGFVESPVKPMTLCLMPATVRQALREP